MADLIGRIDLGGFVRKTSAAEVVAKVTEFGLNDLVILARFCQDY